MNDEWGHGPWSIVLAELGLPGPAYELSNDKCDAHESGDEGFLKALRLR